MGCGYGIGFKNDGGAHNVYLGSQRRHSIGGVRALTFSPDGKKLVAGGIGQISNIDHLGGKARIRIFDWEKAETLAELESDEIKGIVERLMFHPKGDWMLAMGGDHKGFALVVDTSENKIVSEVKTPANHAHDFTWNEEGDRIYVASLSHPRVTSIAEEPQGQAQGQAPAWLRLSP